MDISREELFELVWNEPASTVAQRLGISDVALGKLCRRLQVPKPPRGYWARKRVGKPVRQPPLPAFIEENEWQIGKDQARSGLQPRLHRRGARLSPRKRELFDHAVRYLRKDGSTDEDFTISDNHLTWIDPDFAAALLVAIGQHYRKWGLAEGAGMRAVQAIEGVAQRLVDDLLPLANDRVIVFSPKDEQNRVSYFRDTSKHAVVRFTPELIRTVAKLANLVRDQSLDFVAHRLDTTHQFWRVRWVHDPSRFVLGETCLCISRTHAWVRYKGAVVFDEEKILETAAVPLERLAPIELLGETEIHTSSIHATTHQQPYSSRLHALRQAWQAYELAEQATLDGEAALEQKTLTQMLSLWWTDEQLNALTHIQNGLRDINSRMEIWCDALEREAEALCLQVLGVRIGDCIACATDDRSVRLRLDRADVFFDDEDNEIVFFLHGSRYRKDGLPGKRSESIPIRVPWRGNI